MDARMTAMSSSELFLVCWLCVRLLARLSTASPVPAPAYPCMYVCAQSEKTEGRKEEGPSTSFSKIMLSVAVVFLSLQFVEAARLLLLLTCVSMVASSSPVSG